MIHKKFSGKAIILSCVLIGIAACSMIIWGAVNATGEGTSDLIISRDTILFTKIEVNSESAIIEGTFAASAVGYKGYEYELVGNALNLWIYQVDLFAEELIGGMSIKIQDDFSSVESIHLMQGEKTPPALIWTRKEV